MALKQQRFLEVLRENLAKMEDRCPGYRDDVLSTILAICQDEKGHSRARSTIKKKVRDHCYRLGQFLHLENK